MHSTLPSANELIRLYSLEPHIEGGYFKQTYRSSFALGNRALATAIYYLLPRGAKSRFHRLTADELWHFYLGGPMLLVELLPDGSSRQTILGSDVQQGHALQYLVAAGTWFGAYPLAEADYSFLGCTVSPGFEYADFELAHRTPLLARYPTARAEIERLTDP